MVRTPSTAFLALSFAALFSSAVVFQRGFDDVQVKTHEVAPGLSYLEGAGGNVGVFVGDDGRVLMIDAQYAGMAAKLDAALDALTDQPVAYLVNTHWHDDHSQGNEHFGKDAAVLAHVNVRRRLTGDPSVPGRKATPPAPARFPSVTFEESITLHIGGQDVLVRHFPSGHTDGDSIVYFPGLHVVHMGDLFFQGRFPFVDRDSGGSVGGMIEAVREVLGFLPEDAKVLPGHGELADVPELVRFVTMLEDAREQVEEALEEGLDAAAMESAGVLSEYDSYSWRFINRRRFLDMLVADLATD